MYVLSSNQAEPRSVDPPPRMKVTTFVDSATFGVT